MARFFRIWPGKWPDAVAQAGGLDAITEEWRTGLHGMSGDDIKRALDVCRRTLAWPPSIAEFRAAVTDGSTSEQRAMSARLAEADAERRALPARTWEESRADGALCAKEMLAKLATAQVRKQPVETAAIVADDDDKVSLEVVERRDAERERALNALQKMQQTKGESCT